MSDLLSSPLLQRVASAAQGAAQAVAAQAQNTVNQQWQQFEEEAAKTQQWREEQQQMQRKQDSRTAEVLLPARAVPARANRIKFSIDDDAVEEGMTPEEVADQIITGLKKRRMTLIVSFRSFGMAMLARLLPRKVSVYLWYQLMEKMR
jgi:hypothetical protein